MENRKLKLYLLLCIVSFFILLLVVLFHSFGYKYDIEDRKTVQTGTILIKTYPEKAKIYINNQHFKRTKTISNLFNDFVRIGGLFSGFYDVEISEEGYFSWKKKISVEKEKITEIKNVVLLKKDFRENVLLSDVETDLELKNIWLSNKKDKIAYKKKVSEKINIIIFDLEDKTQKIIFASDKLNQTYAEKSYVFREIIWFDNDKKIIIKIINNNDEYLYYLVDLEDSDKLYNLNYVFDKNQDIIYKTNFDSTKELIFYLKNNTLYSLNYKKQISKKIIEGVAGFFITNNYIYYLKTDDKTLYSAKHNELPINPEKIFTMPETIETKSPTTILKSGYNYIVLSSSGKLYLINNGRKTIFINSFIKDAYFFADGKRIIYYNDHEIWTYYIKEKIPQPYKKEFTNELITRHGGNISNVSLYKDGEHLFYKESNVLKFTELDDRDKRNIFDLIQFENNDIFYFENYDLILYLKDNKLIKLILDEENNKSPF